MKKQQILYLHGGESFHNYEDFLERLKTANLWHMQQEGEAGLVKKWTSSLQEDLVEGFEIIAPPMPNKQNAKFLEWSIWFERHFEFLDDGVILIGYSLGAMFLAKYLSEYNVPFKSKAVFLLAGAYALPDFSDRDCKDFLVSPKEVRKLLPKTDNLVIMHSEDDFVVPFAHAVELNKIVPEAELMSFTDKNHFLIEEFPELLDKIREI